MGAACRPRCPRMPLLLLAAMPLPAVAHLVGSVDVSTPWWRSVDPYSAALLLLTAVLYARGSAALAKRARDGRRAHRRQALCFWSGLAILAAALVSPLDAWGEQLFSAHMVQHELLILGAAPLLVAARPLAALLWSMPRGWRLALAQQGASAGWRLPWCTLSAPLTAWTLHALALWQWHLPLLFEAALADAWMHTLQHLSFFVSALIFWWSLLGTGGHAARPGMGVIYVFSTAVHSSLLGALLTFSPTAWYAPYAGTAPRWGLTALQDQQLGGLIMWVPSGLVFIVIGLVLLERWIWESQRRTDRHEGRTAAPRRSG